MLYNFLRPIIKFLIKLVYKVDIRGLENLPPNNTGFLIAGNHIHIFDPLMVAIYFNDRHLNFMGKDELFDTKFKRWFFKKVYVIPVKREDNDIAAIKNAMKVLKRKEPLCIFPEGTRNLNLDEMLEPKGGLTLLAIKLKVPILPVAITGEYKFRKTIHVNIGTPIYFDEYYGKKLNGDEYVTICKDKVYPVIEELKIRD